MRTIITTTLISYMLVLTGCARQQLETVEQICIQNITKAKAMEAGEDVLGRFHFRIDKSDAELGYIRTRPLASAKFFEFWRNDNVGWRNSAEANLHSIRRIVELDIARQGGQLCIGCDVKVQRLNLPETDVTSSGRVYGMFSASGRSMQKLKLRPEQRKNIVWIELGPDEKLATKILKSLEEQIANR